MFSSSDDIHMTDMGDAQVCFEVSYNCVVYTLFANVVYMLKSLLPLVLRLFCHARVQYLHNWAMNSSSDDVSMTDMRDAQVWCCPLDCRP